MANFTTHIAVGTLVAGALATMTTAADVLAPDNVVAVTLAGVVGSVLPDIDLKDSRPARALFAGLGIFFSFCVLFSIASKYSIAEMWLLWLGTLVGVRYGGEWLLHRFSYHRGIFHSILAGVMFWFMTAVIFGHLMGLHPGVGWLAGGFLFIGYMTHLLLDEIYSVDVMDRRLKMSFGSALKLVDAKHPGQTGLVAAVTVLLLMVSPTPKPFIDGITAPGLWDGLRSRLLPHDAWFQGLAGKIETELAVPQASEPTHAATTTSPISTGSLPEAAPKQ